MAGCGDLNRFLALANLIYCYLKYATLRDGLTAIYNKVKSRNFRCKLEIVKREENQFGEK